MVSKMSPLNIFVKFDGENALFVPVPLPVNNETIYATFEEAREEAIRLCEKYQEELIQRVTTEKQRILSLSEEEALRSSEQFS